MTNEQALKQMSDSLVNKILTNTKQDNADPLKILQQYF